MAHSTTPTGRPVPQICLDTETTGLDPAGGDRIIDVGCVRLDGRVRSLDKSYEFQRLINPDKVLDDEIVELTGITNEDLADKPRFEEIVDDFLDFIRGSELLIHNAAFDVGFLNMELERCGRGKLEDYVVNIVDTLDIAHELFPGRHVSLTALCVLLGIDDSERTVHGALIDSQILGDVYLAMTRGQNQLEVDYWDDSQKLRLYDESRMVVIRADEDELKEHERILDICDKKSKSVCAWRKLAEGSAAKEEKAGE